MKLSDFTKEVLAMPVKTEQGVVKPMLHYYTADPATAMFKHMTNMINTYGADKVSKIIESLKKEGIL